MCGVVGEAIIKSEPSNSHTPSSSTSLLTLPSGASISLLPSPSLSPNNPRKQQHSSPADCCNDTDENSAILRVMTSPIQDGGGDLHVGKDMFSLSLIPSAAPPGLLIPSLLSSVVSTASLISGHQHPGNILMCFHLRITSYSKSTHTRLWRNT